MSSEKRLVLFMILTFSSFLAIQYVMDVMGLNPPPPKDMHKVQADAKPGEAKPEAGKAPAAVAEKRGEPKPAEDAKPAGEAKAAGPKVALAKAGELVLGSTRERAPGAYHLEVELEQKGAGVARIESSLYDAEFIEGRGKRRKPLTLLRSSPLTVPPFAVSVRAAGEAAADDPAGKPRTESPLAEVLWDVVRDEAGHAVRTISRVDPATKARVEGQEVAFRTHDDELALDLTKRFRLWKGADALEMTLEVESPEKDRSIVYRLFGPNGIPIEGEWYTGTFRDVFFGQLRGDRTEIVTKAAYDIAKPKAARFDNTAAPLVFAGIENQYFTVFVEPVPPPKGQADRRESEAVATVVEVKPDEIQKADVSVEILSRPFQVGPNRELTHAYRIYAGPKTLEALAPYAADGLATYRKSGWFTIPGASTMARYVIAPLLDRIYALTAQVARAFGGKAGNYGVAIILLTLLVRMIMFPLGRKQALAAKKMQDLQPLLKEIQEKYKDDKEKQTRETFALYKKHGVNPVGGCLPALIQLPIFVGLWQALNNSVHLRHASFLYIENLAAPDMLFKFPFQGGLPLLGEYFNVLPFLVVALMLVQTKLFSPPATTPEAEAQQKMMKYMMIVMAFMFYKVPSGLGIYFITSSLWQISERLLLPKVSHVNPGAGPAGDDKNLPPGGGRGGPGGGGRGGPDGNGAPNKPPGKLAQFWEKVKQEAAKDTTHRNVALPDREREKDRDKDKTRARPGRRR